jgi:N utilization substance protein B
MGSRRKSREIALQVLYLQEFSKTDVKEALDHFWRKEDQDPPVMEFATQLIHGVLKNVESLDKLLSESSDHWRLDRMAIVDLNVMRLAVFEFLYMSDTPGRVVINEALEVAKRFSTGESTQFINGILDNIRKKIESGDIEKA